MKDSVINKLCLQSAAAECSSGSDFLPGWHSESVRVFLCACLEKIGWASDDAKVPAFYDYTEAITKLKSTAEREGEKEGWV